jgi:beta-aspartyl-peptidase (threonine type)
MNSTKKENIDFSIAIHGGAGTILRSNMTPEIEASYLEALEEALAKGEAILKQGGSALDAVSASVVSMENNILFNAGRGSVFSHDGTQQMDAAIMCGRRVDAGAVTAIDEVRNPILLCREILEKSEHIMLSAEGAKEFAKLNKLEFKPKDWFFSEFRHKQYLEALAEDRVQLDHSNGNFKYGTVGAVAKDIHGDVAAATSTGGMTNKKFGRVGDSPIIGSGTYANNETCAISCTGNGEAFMREVVGHEISSLMKYANMNLSEACDKVVYEILPKIDGSGGLIGVDKKGHIVLPFNSEGMYRGFSKSNGEREIAIYK